MKSKAKQLHGTTRSLINDAIIGVSEIYKTLEIVGIDTVQLKMVQMLF